MDKKRTGIAVAGSVIVDKINKISAYPNAGELTQIRSIQNAAGGCVPNVALDLKRIAPSMEVHAVGTIGDDEEAKAVRKALTKTKRRIERGINLGLEISALRERLKADAGITDEKVNPKDDE